MSGQEFTASNGCRVARIATAEDGGRLTVFAPSAYNNQQKGTSTSYLIDMQVDALREFFQQERDTELGRWRYSPTLVVYPTPNHQPFMHTTGRAVLVFDESECRFHERHEGRDSAWCETRPELTAAAAAYFAAHPEPTPWHDAMPGEVWVLTYDGEEGVYMHSNGAWYGQALHRIVLEHPIRDVNVTAGRRIWPEPDHA